MNIQSGRNPVRHQPVSRTKTGSPLSSKLKPAFFTIFMIIAVACIFQLHVYLKSGISSFANDIDRTKQDIKNTELEITNLRNKIEERNQLSYVKRQIVRFNLKLRAPEPGQMHDAVILSKDNAHVAAMNMQRAEFARMASLNAKPGEQTSPTAVPAVVERKKNVTPVRTVPVARKFRSSGSVRRMTGKKSYNYRDYRFR